MERIPTKFNRVSSNGRALVFQTKNASSILVARIYGIVVESGLLHCPAKTEGPKTSKGSNPFDSAQISRTLLFEC